MSAYLCDAAHLAAIARATAAAFDASNGAVLVGGAERVFSLLLDTNLRSIGARYPNEGEAAFIWENIPEATHTARELLELIGSYRYQSCEHDEWNGSDAEVLTKALAGLLQPHADAEKAAEHAKQAERKRAISALPALYGKQTAVQLRKVLKANFPATKFSVRSDFNSVRVSWTDGPTFQRVDALVGGFKAGRFNGMTDSYDYDNTKVLTIDGTNYRPRCEYISTNRETSPELARKAAALVAAYYNVSAPEITVTKWGGWTITADSNATGTDWSTLIYQATTDRTRFQREG